MGFKILVSILLLSILFLGCSSVNFVDQPDYSRRNYKTFNQLGSKHKSTIYFLNGKQIETSYVFAKQDSIFYQVTDVTLAISQSQVERITINILSRKIGTGFFYGVLGYASIFLVGALGEISIDGFGMSFIVLPIATILGISVWSKN